MAEDKSFKGYIIALVLVSLFALSFYNFAIGIGTEYNPNYAVEYLGQSESFMSYSDINDSLDSFDTNSQAWENQSKQDSPYTSGGDVLFLGLWDVMTGMWEAINGLFNIFASGLNHLGVPPIVIGLVVALFIIGLIFAGWRAIKQGS